MSGNTYQWPHGPVDEIAVTSGATMAATIKNSKTQITISQMAAAGTLNLTVSDKVPVGAELLIKVSADGTNRALTPGTGMTGNAFTVTASKSFTLKYEYDGSKFLHVADKQLN